MSNKKRSQFKAIFGAASIAVLLAVSVSVLLGATLQDGQDSSEIKMKATEERISPDLLRKAFFNMGVSLYTWEIDLPKKYNLVFSYKRYVSGKEKKNGHLATVELSEGNHNLMLTVDHRESGAPKYRFDVSGHSFESHSFPVWNLPKSWGWGVWNGQLSLPPEKAVPIFRGQDGSTVHSHKTVDDFAKSYDNGLVIFAKLTTESDDE